MDKACTQDGSCEVNITPFCDNQFAKYFYEIENRSWIMLMQYLTMIMPIGTTNACVF